MSVPWLRNTTYAVSLAAMLLLSVTAAIMATRFMGWETAVHAHPSAPAGNPSLVQWASLRGQVPSSVVVCAPTWLPATVRDLSPSYTTGGGGGVWDYTLSYWDSARSGARTPLTFTEDSPTPQCPSPPCLRDGPRAGRPLPAGIRQRLPHAQLFIGQHLPAIVLRWRVGMNVYSIQAHSLSLNDVLRVASSAPPPVV